MTYALRLIRRLLGLTPQIDLPWSAWTGDQLLGRFATQNEARAAVKGVRPNEVMYESKEFRKRFGRYTPASRPDLPRS